MEKKQANFFTAFKPAFIAAFVLFSYSGTAQKMETFKDYFGGFYKSVDDLFKMQEKEIGFYEFKPRQTI